MAAGQEDRFSVLRLTRFVRGTEACSSTKVFCAFSDVGRRVCKIQGFFCCCKRGGGFSRLLLELLVGYTVHRNEMLVWWQWLASAVIQWRLSL